MWDSRDPEGAGGARKNLLGNWAPKDFKNKPKDITYSMIINFVIFVYILVLVFFAKDSKGNVCLDIGFLGNYAIVDEDRCSNLHYVQGQSMILADPC